MFTSRHAQELGEIRALASDLRQCAKGAEEQLYRVTRTQARQLAGRDRQEASSGIDEGDPGALLAFVHIPKTAGGTATTMLQRAYTKEGLHSAGNYVKGPENTVKKVERHPGGWERWHEKGGRVSIGHVPYAVFREHLPPDTRYMTFLREPVDRVLSHYYRHVHHPELTPAQRRARREKGRETAASIEEALREFPVPQLRNLATRFLCGHPSPMGELPASAVDDAKANLREFAFVGVQERFEESIVLLQRMLGLGPVPYLNRHVSIEGGRPSVEEISAEERALIEECNRLDLELYEFALKLFEDDVAATDDRFADDLEALRALSADANQDAIRTAREWLDREAPAGLRTKKGALRPTAKEAGVPIPALKQVLDLLPLTHRVFALTEDAADQPVEPLLGFVHIPRTGGATVKLVLADAYSKAAVREVGDYFNNQEKVAVKLAVRPSGWESWSRRGGRVAVGHVPYGLFREHLPADTRYLTFVREPVERVLSQHHSQAGGWPIAAGSRLRWMDAFRGRREMVTTDSLEEALLEPRLPQLSNLATRFLSGHPSPTGELPASALDDAKANLSEFAFVGIQERFEESIVLLRRMLGLDLHPHLNAKVGIERPAVEEISSEQRALIEECNRLDAELYTFAVGLFEEAVAAADEGFADDVETLRASSVAANEEAIRTARSWLDHELPPGTAKPKQGLFAAAEGAGIPIPALRHVSDLLSVTKERHDDGRMTWTRTEGADGDRTGIAT